ncbi:hypothetical protein [Rhizobium leguminosarum]|uniref:hypothetical protein n=1 Tax=Rhizobium leguminosarum TaxID=384 RepID=UPI0004265F81|nr:hypothetical protein [Rhizobium leguminosarum]
MSAISELANVVSKIANLSSTETNYHGIGEARYMPFKMSWAAQRIRFTADNGYGKPEPESEAIALEMHKRLTAEYQAKAEAAMRDRLRAISRELEALRAILPSLAAKAAVEAGVIARQCETEAGGAA